MAITEKITGELMAASFLAGAGEGLADARAESKVINDLAGRWYEVPRNLRFSQAIRGMRKREQVIFGSNGDLDPTFETKFKLDTMEKVPARFNLAQGEFDANNNYVGGTGWSTINAEPQNYARSFTDPVFQMQATGLLIKPTVGAGEFGFLARGGLKLNPTRGFFNNNLGTAVATDIADIGLVPGDLANLKVRGLVNACGYGWSAVRSIDTANNQIVFDHVNGGVKNPQTTGQWVLHFLKDHYFLRVAPGQTVARGVSRDVPLAEPAPPEVVVGMNMRGVAIGTEIRAASTPRLLSISNDRLTLTFDRNVDVQTFLVGDNGDGVIMYPGLTSGQLWHKRAIGAHLEGRRGSAWWTRLQLANIPIATTQQDIYTKADYEAWLAANPGSLPGYWPADWCYLHRPLSDADDIMIGQRTVAGYPFYWNEIDNLEIFSYPGGPGSAGYTCNMHRQPMNTRFILDGEGGVDSFGRFKTFHGGSWLTSTGNNQDITPNSKVCKMPSTICGPSITIAGIQDRGKTIIYYNDIPLLERDWVPTSPYAMQHGWNVAMGQMTMGNSYRAFLPHSNAEAASMTMLLQETRFFDI